MKKASEQIKVLWNIVKHKKKKDWVRVVIVRWEVLHSLKDKWFDNPGRIELQLKEYITSSLHFVLFLHALIK